MEKETSLVFRGFMVIGIIVLIVMAFILMLYMIGFASIHGSDALLGKLIEGVK